MGKPLFIHKLRLYTRCIMMYSVLIGTVHINTGTFSCQAQPSRINTLIKSLDKAKHDTDRVNIYYSISRLYWSKNADSALLMAGKSLDLAKKIHFEKGIALAYLAKGVALGYKGNWPEALDSHLQCLRISEKLGMEGLSENEYGNIAGLYTSMDDYPKALYYNQQAYKIAIKQKGPARNGIFNLLVNMGEIFKKKGQPDSAIAYNSRALVIAKRIKDPVDMAAAMYNIAENLITNKKYLVANTYLTGALYIAKKAGDDEDVAYCHGGLALTSYYTGKYHLSMLYAQKCLKESKKSGILELIQTAYRVLYLTHQKTGGYKQALYYRNLEIALNDSLKTAEKEKAIKDIQLTYELDKKQAQINLLNKDKIINRKELEKVRLKRDILTGGAILLLLLAMIQFRSYRQKRKLNEQLALQNKNISAQNLQLEELVHVKDRLFSIIGHDLRGPIQTVSQMMNIVKEKSLPQEEHEFWIEKICDTLLMTSKLAENLLYWAKSQLDGIQPNPTCFDVQKVIDQNITLLKQRAAEKKVLITGMEKAGPETVYGDETMIDIVIRNLLENAVKFSKAGDQITVTAEKQENFTVVTIKDNGRGIPAEAQSLIFNKFVSHTTFGTASEKGSGLGLLLCKELVESNNGTLWFESREGIGSSFYFSIPASK
ncbi:tetratricopeptide repeat-containing sensor histidine kinase [Mucilaginibacter dorajii]|nr:tetratricopeptide repeat-containing sensor histidine kinase [Mucilaginibacter dorajii]MCS3732613.1 signal transduction histidine kinase [Mucilaginibacter dorajii]